MAVFFLYSIIIPGNIFRARGAQHPCHRWADCLHFVDPSSFFRFLFGFHFLCMSVCAPRHPHSLFVARFSQPAGFFTISVDIWLLDDSVRTLFVYSSYARLPLKLTKVDLFRVYTEEKRMVKANSAHPLDRVHKKLQKDF